MICKNEEVVYTPKGFVIFKIKLFVFSLHIILDSLHQNRQTGFGVLDSFDTT